MSLVAYDASSESEESDNDNDGSNKVEILKENGNAPRFSEECNGNISDDEEYQTVAVELNQLKKSILNLPAPINTTPNIIENDEEVATPQFCKLPSPKTTEIKTNQIIEEDDEFLKKRELPVENLEKEKPPPAPTTKGRVKITIPSLKEFHEVDSKCSKLEMNPNASKKPSKGSSLLSILPPAKSERNFSKPSNTELSVEKPSAYFVPDTVKNRRSALNTENIDKSSTVKKANSANKFKPEPKLAESENDTSDDETNEDFFSLNAEEKLPEISINEINRMVAKRSVQMAEASTIQLEFQKESNVEIQKQAAEDQLTPDELDDSVIQALVGNRAKRRKKNDEQIQIVEISSEQVHPSREEWMRSALASSTSYQPTGVLVDEEPASGTRRKHQITYLAHKALANEAELQAMWSANRHARRATQSKYGF